MPQACLFCNNPAGSKEHLWAAWIHKRKDFGPLKVTIGGSPQEIRNDPEQKIDTVCADCNNGWMSALAGCGKTRSGRNIDSHHGFRYRKEMEISFTSTKAYRGPQFHSQLHVFDGPD